MIRLMTNRLIHKLIIDVYRLMACVQWRKEGPGPPGEGVWQKGEGDSMSNDRAIIDELIDDY